jgi:hypothetical protein
MEFGKAKYIFSPFFNNDFDNNGEGNLYKIVIHFMQCKTVVIKEHPLML